MLSGSTPATKLSVDQLLDRLRRERLAERPLIKQIEARADELAALGADLLSAFIPLVTPALILQVLQRQNPDCLSIRSDLHQGWLTVESSVGPNYGTNTNQSFEEADRITSQCLRSWQVMRPWLLRLPRGCADVRCRSGQSGSALDGTLPLWLHGPIPVLSALDGRQNVFGQGLVGNVAFGPAIPVPSRVD